MALLQSSKAKKIYDEVTDEDYKLIVRERLDGDDFIEDDDGSGYVDNGMDDFGAEDSDEGEDSDDSDAGTLTNTISRFKLCPCNVDDRPATCMARVALPSEMDVVRAGRMQTDSIVSFERRSQTQEQEEEGDKGCKRHCKGECRPDEAEDEEEALAPTTTRSSQPVQEGHICRQGGRCHGGYIR